MKLSHSQPPVLTSIMTQVDKIRQNPMREPTSKMSKITAGGTGNKNGDKPTATHLVKSALVGSLMFIEPGFEVYNGFQEGSVNGDGSKNTGPFGTSGSGGITVPTASYSDPVDNIPASGSLTLNEAFGIPGANAAGTEVMGLQDHLVAPPKFNINIAADKFTLEEAVGSGYRAPGDVTPDHVRKLLGEQNPEEEVVDFVPYDENRLKNNLDAIAGLRERLPEVLNFLKKHEGKRNKLQRKTRQFNREIRKELNRDVLFTDKNIEKLQAMLEGHEYPELLEYVDQVLQEYVPSFQAKVEQGQVDLHKVDHNAHIDATINRLAAKLSAVGTPGPPPEKPVIPHPEPQGFWRDGYVHNVAKFTLMHERLLVKITEAPTETIAIYYRGIYNFVDAIVNYDCNRYRCDNDRADPQGQPRSFSLKHDEVLRRTTRCVTRYYNRAKAAAQRSQNLNPEFYVIWEIDEQIAELYDDLLIYGSARGSDCLGP